MHARGEKFKSKVNDFGHFWANLTIVINPENYCELCSCMFNSFRETLKSGISFHLRDFSFK